VAKITSVLDLSKYKVGEPAYRVYLQHKRLKIDESEELLITTTPTVLHQKPENKHIWANTMGRTHKKMPALGPADFLCITNILTSELAIQEFVVESVIRNNYGIYVYTGTCGGIAPESSLFDTLQAAKAEKSRILNMLQRWINNYA